MKIKQIEIERFGVWRGLSLPLSESGMQVFYGPNEAGKSTLMRFLRAMLYGFPPPAEGEPRAPVAGRIDFLADNQCWRWQRTSVEGQPDRVSLASVERPIPHEAGFAFLPPSSVLDCGSEFRGPAEVETPAEEIVAVAPGKFQDWLQGISAEIYHDIFAIDLRELQELATLSDEEAARRIYGLTIGAEGERLLELTARAHRERLDTVTASRSSGQLLLLLHARDEVQRQLDALRDRPAEHAEVCAQIADLQQEVDDLLRRKASARREQRGYEFLARSSIPWRELRDCQTQLADLPDLSEFPAEGVARLERLEQEINRLEQARDERLQAARQARLAGRITVDPQIRRNAAALHGLVTHHDWLESLLQEHQAAQVRVSAAAAALDTARRELGPEWTETRLQAIVPTPAGYRLLTNHADSLRKAIQRRAVIRDRKVRLVRAIDQQQELLTLRAQELGGATVSEALAMQRARLEELKHLAQLRLQQQELAARQSAIAEHRARVAPREVLPTWTYGVLAAFGGIGGGLSVLGLVTGLMVNALAGAVYALVGLSGLGLAWGLKTVYERSARQEVESLQAAEDQAAGEWETIQKEFHRLAHPVSPSESEWSEANFSEETQRSTAMPFPARSSTAVPATIFTGTAPELGLIRDTLGRIAELEELGLRERKLHRSRKRLRQLRTRQAIARQEVDTARARWQELLVDLNFPESTRVSAALTLWHNLFDVADSQRTLAAAHAEAEHVHRLATGYQQRIRTWGQRMGDFQSDYDQPLAILARWEQELSELARQRGQRQDLRAQFRAHKKEIRELRRELRQRASDRQDLLDLVGACDREEFLELAAAWDEQQALTATRQRLRDELHVVQAEFADLAVTEADMEQYEAVENTRRLAALGEAVASLEQDEQAALAELDRWRQELQKLEEDEHATDLRYELSQLESRLHAAVGEWLAIETAGQALDELRGRYEREHQPALLATASGFLEQLTLGKYRSCWIPLGQHELKVDDEQGRSLAVAHLSRATREQLFLAVRLAVIQDLAHKGTVLPMILDDILVNFDEARAAAAMRLLAEFSQRGQQVLFFTCHKHLAQQFGDAGADVITLPPHNQLREEARLAG